MNGKRALHHECGGNFHGQYLALAKKKTETIVDPLIRLLSVKHSYSMSEKKLPGFWVKGFNKALSTAFENRRWTPL